MERKAPKQTKEVPIDTLRALIDYDAETGVMKWKVRDASWFKSEHAARSWNKRWAGTLALNTCMLPSRGDRKGYLGGHVLYKKLLAHRVAFAHFHGKWPDVVVDHVNGDTSDNRISNLREATYQQNCINREKSRSNTSGYTNIKKTPSGRYAVHISVGVFDTVEDAIENYNAASVALHGGFAVTLSV